MGPIFIVSIRFYGSYQIFRMFKTSCIVHTYILCILTHTHIYTTHTHAHIFTHAHTQTTHTHTHTHTHRHTYSHTHTHTHTHTHFTHTHTHTHRNTHTLSHTYTALMKINEFALKKKEKKNYMIEDLHANLSNSSGILPWV